MGRYFRTFFGSLAVAIVWVLGCALSPAWSQTSDAVIDDPVEDLRQTLLERDKLQPSLPDKEFRTKTLKDRIAALKTLPDLRRGLMLKEWREDLPGTGEIHQIDLEQRQKLSEKFKSAIADLVEHGSRDQKLVVASMIADLLPTFRAPGKDEFTGLTRTFTPEVLKLAEDSDAGVRQQGLLTLSVIHAPPDKAAAVYRKVLEKDADVKFKRLAARGLSRMMEVVNTLQQPTKTTTPVKVTGADVMRTAQEVVPVCLIGVKDPDGQVQAICIEGIQNAALGLESLVEMFKNKKDQLPPMGRPLNDIEIQQLKEEYEKTRGQFKVVEPFFKLLKDAAPDLAAALGNDQLPVRLSAISTLETIAGVRLISKQRLGGVHLNKLYKLHGVKLIVLEDPLGEFLKDWLPQAMNLRGDKNAAVRQKLFEFLELLDADAVLALPALVDGLEDPDPVVKLITARAWKMLVQAPRILSDDQMKLGVPGLAKLLSHPEGPVRREAAKALEWIGAPAGACKRSIGHAVRIADAEGKLLIFPVVARLAAGDALDFVPELIKCLTHEDWHLREGAAKTLGRIGPVAVQAIPALRRLIGDPVEEVRQAGRDALLSILPSAK